MPRATQPARLWLRPAGGTRKSVWLILDAGKQHSTGCGPDARRAAEERLAEYLRGKHDPVAIVRHSPERTRLSDILSVYLDEVVPQQRQPTKVAARILRLLDWWGDMMLAEVSPATCREYAQHRNVAPRTVGAKPRLDGSRTVKVVEATVPRSGGGARRDLEDLRAAINHHASRGLHTGMATVTLPPKGKPRAKFLTQKEVADLLRICWRHTREQIPPRGPRAGQRVASAEFYDLRHLARFILMGIYTGSRTAPILKASIERGPGRAWVDLDAEIYHRLPEDMVEASNKRQPAVRLSPRLAAHIRRWRDQGAIASYVVEWNGAPVKSIKTAWIRAVKLANLQGNPTPHTLRHTAVSWAKQRGESSFDVSNYVGMSEKMVEEVYGHHDPEFQRGMAQRMGYRRVRK